MCITFVVWPDFVDLETKLFFSPPHWKRLKYCTDQRFWTTGLWSVLRSFVEPMIPRAAKCHQGTRFFVLLKRLQAMAVSLAKHDSRNSLLSIAVVIYYLWIKFRLWNCIFYHFLDIDYFIVIYSSSATDIVKLREMSPITLWT